MAKEKRASLKKLAELSKMIVYFAVQRCKIRLRYLPLPYVTWPPVEEPEVKLEVPPAGVPVPVEPVAEPEVPPLVPPPEPELPELPLVPVFPPVDADVPDVPPEAEGVEPAGADPAGAAAAPEPLSTCCIHGSLRVNTLDHIVAALVLLDDEDGSD